MACGRFVGRFRFRVPVQSSSEMWEPIGQPLVIVGGHTLDYAMTIATASDGATAIPATALMAAREDEIAEIRTASGDWSAKMGTTHHVSDLEGAPDRFLAQPGVFARLARDARPGYVAGTLSIVLHACGAMIGTRSIEAAANQTADRPQLFPIGRVPAAGADKLRAAVVANAVNGLEYRFEGRGVNDPDAPSAWRPITRWAFLEDDHSAICVPDAQVDALAPREHHQLEFAIAIRLRAGAENPSGFLRVAAGLSYA
jgi:hypothetical protein